MPVAGTGSARTRERTPIRLRIRPRPAPVRGSAFGLLAALLAIANRRLDPAPGIE